MDSTEATKMVIAWIKQDEEMASLAGEAALIMPPEMLRGMVESLNPGADADDPGEPPAGFISLRARPLRMTAKDLDQVNWSSVAAAFKP